jgi:hypothetical protein
LSTGYASFVFYCHAGLLGSDWRRKKTLRLAAPAASPHRPVRRWLHARPWNGLVRIVQTVTVLGHVSDLERYHLAIVLSAAKFLRCWVHSPSVDPKIVCRGAANTGNRDHCSHAECAHAITSWVPKPYPRGRFPIMRWCLIRAALATKNVVTMTVSDKACMNVRACTMRADRDF